MLQLNHIDQALTWSFENERSTYEIALARISNRIFAQWTNAHQTKAHRRYAQWTFAHPRTGKTDICSPRLIIYVSPDYRHLV